MKMQLLRWNNGEPTPGPDTRPASSMVTGAGCRGENPRLRRREKNVLDNAFYRAGVSRFDRAIGIYHQFSASSERPLMRSKTCFASSALIPTLRLQSRCSFTDFSYTLTHSAKFICVASFGWL